MVNANEYNRQAQNPMSEYLLKLQLIVSNTIFKDGAEAKKYETTETLLQGDKYVSAMTGKDIFESYQYDSREIYTYLESKGYDEDKIFFLIKNPTMIPQKYKTELMEKARNEFVESYEENNRYYLMLSGKPYPGSINYPADDIVLIPDAFYEQYESEGLISRGEPIHELPKRYQELFMNSELYSQTIKEHPNAKYLNYIGSNSVSIVTSRNGKDGDILLVNTNKLSTYHPVFGNVTVSYDIVHKFISVYKETRDYVYQTLRGDFGDIYANYNDFIRFLTIYLTIGNCMNEFLKHAGSLVHMNNVTANNLFTLYGLPSVIMEGTSMIEFLKKFRMLLMDKGTNIVYRVKDLIGYDDTDIYTLVMVKQQEFQNGVPIYVKDPKTGELTPRSRIVFRRLGTTEENTSYFKFRESSTEYDYEKIRDADPRWWNSEETERMILEMNYTLSNSKYIQLSTHLSMTDIWWQCVILLRGLLDNEAESKGTLLNINYSINGTSSMTIFDAVLSLIIIMGWELKSDQRHFMGELLIPNGTWNGKDACLDTLCNGLNNASMYKRGASYAKGEIIGIPMYESGKGYVPADNTWYIAANDFVAIQPHEKGGPDVDDMTAITMELNERGTISKYADFIDYDYDYPLGSPKDLTFGKPYKIASFNFKLKDTQEGLDFYNSISGMNFVNPDVFLPMLDAVLEREDINMGEVLMTDVKLIQQYLSTKLRDARRILDYRNISDIYRNLFLVDPLRSWYTKGEFDVDAQLVNKFELTNEELYAFKRFFSYDSKGYVIVEYLNRNHIVYLYDVLNQKADTILVKSRRDDSSDDWDAGSYPFKDIGFIHAFDKLIDSLSTINNIEASSLSDKIKNNGRWKTIIKTKVDYDYGDVDGYPRTYEDLMMRNNNSLYDFLMNVKENKSSDDVVTFLRAIIKALENYVNSSLAGLEFKALGVDNYFYILKEVISYFKSYMVEFTRDEFVYIFDGIFDNGGNPNMLKLIDEIAQGVANPVVHDSTSLYDVSCAEMNYIFDDDNSGFLYDDILIRAESTYGDMVSSGYELWFDDGKRITRTPPNIPNDTKVIANIIPDEKDPVAYKLIVNINNLNPIPSNYYGNTR